MSPSFLYPREPTVCLAQSRSSIKRRAYIRPHEVLKWAHRLASLLRARGVPEYRKREQSSPADLRSPLKTERGVHKPFEV
jgi:hypothetical protein